LTAISWWDTHSPKFARGVPGLPTRRAYEEGRVPATSTSKPRAQKSPLQRQGPQRLAGASGPQVSLRRDAAGELNVKDGSGEIQTEGQWAELLPPTRRPLEWEIASTAACSSGASPGSSGWVRVPDFAISGKAMTARNPWISGPAGIYGHQPARRVVPATTSGFQQRPSSLTAATWPVWVNGYQVSDWNRPPAVERQRAPGLPPPARAIISLQGARPHHKSLVPQPQDCRVPEAGAEQLESSGPGVRSCRDATMAPDVVALSLRLQATGSMTSRQNNRRIAELLAGGPHEPARWWNRLRQLRPMRSRHVMTEGHRPPRRRLRRGRQGGAMPEMTVRAGVANGRLCSDARLPRTATSENRGLMGRGY